MSNQIQHIYGSYSFQSEPVFPKFDILTSRLDLVVYAKMHLVWEYITHLLDKKREIRREYMSNLYLNLDRLPPILIVFFLEQKKAKHLLNRTIDTNCNLLAKIH